MVVLSIILSVNVFNKGCDSSSCQAMLYVATTFLSSRRIETSLGFPVATERDLTDSTQLAINDPTSATKDKAYRFGHFFECMYTARMADKTCSPSLSLNDYTVCIQNSTAMSTGLDACAAFPTVGGYSHWPTSEEYLACLWNNPLFQNSEVRRASQNVFRACVDQSLWPFFEIPQSIDSPYIFGSYNWGYLLVTGMVVLSSFVVYTASPWEAGHIDRGESGAFMRLGLAWSGVAFIWNCVYFIVFNVLAFRGGNGSANSETSVTTASTTFVTIFGLGAAVLYFLSIITRPFTRKYYARLYSSQSSIAAIQVAYGDAPHGSDCESHGLLLGGTFPDTVNPDGSLVKERSYELTSEQVTKMYTPPMLAIWSDSYMVDFCFFLGLAGATGQLSTDVAWCLFSLTFTYRILGMIISRCMSDAFMNNVRLEKDLNTYKNNIHTRPSIHMSNKNENRQKHELDVHLSPKVIGLATQLACFFLYYMVLYLVYNENSTLKDYTYFSLFVIAGFAIPEALRLLVHVYYQFSYDAESMGDVPWLLYNSFYFIWMWDVFFRLLVVALVVLEANNTAGTFDYLKTQSNALMRDYIVAFSTTA